MKIIELLKNKQADINGNKAVTIAFLGDSVTQGCFECYLTSPESLETVYDYKSAYSTRVKEILNFLYPAVQINVINAGISGDFAASGLNRLERDVLTYSPDLVVVSYGLNDSCQGGGAEAYGKTLGEIFKRISAAGAECIFLTQNYMCEKTSPRLNDDLFIRLSKQFSKIQNDGVLDEYFVEAKKQCGNYGVAVCDVRSAWAALSAGGANVTELLANKLNHPVREFHYYMAIKLIETMFGL